MFEETKDAAAVLRSELNRRLWPNSFIRPHPLILHDRGVDVRCYLGERPPVHISAADVKVPPVHYPEGGM